MYFYICKNTTIKIQQCYILPTYTFLATGLLFGITHPTLTVQYPGASTEHRRTLPKVEITGKSLTIPEHNSASGRGGRPCFHFSFQQPPRGLNTLPVGKPRAGGEGAGLALPVGGRQRRVLADPTAPKKSDSAEPSVSSSDGRLGTETPKLPHMQKNTQRMKHLQFVCNAKDRRKSCESFESDR